jgi:uncharacterized protein
VTTAYVDSSALVKLVIDEPDAKALRRFLAIFDEHATSRVGIVETRRVLARHGAHAATTEAILEPLGVVEVDAAVASTAAVLRPLILRTLDAIHLATALAVYQVDVFVTYDSRLAEAARETGFTVAAPTQG